MKHPVSQLRHHPLNEEIYDISNIEELLTSIQEVGLLQPLTIDHYNQLALGIGDSHPTMVRKFKMNDILVY